MFVVTAAGVIMALDPATGATLWTFKPETPFSGKRGVGIGDGLLFAGLRNSNVMAISQETGKLVWTSEHPKEIPSQGMATAPAYGNGVVVGVVSLGDNFLHGRAIGYDAKTGKFLWSFDVVPGPGEPGHETWPQDSDIWKYGGGAIWTTPSVDAELGLVYLPDRQCGAAIRRRAEAGQQPLQQLGRRARSQDRKDAVVFPDRPSRHLGTRSEHAAGAVRHDDWRAIAQGAGGDADRRHPVHPRPRDRQAAGAGRRAAGEAGCVPEDVADAAVHHRRRSGRARMRGKGHDPARVHRRLLLRSDLHRSAQPVSAAHEHAPDADGVQPADQLLVRRGLRQPGLDETRQHRLGVHPADAASRPETVRRARRDRRPDREDRLAEAPAVFRVRGQRRRA